MGTLFSAGFSMLDINQKMGAVDPVAFDDLTKVIQELKDTRHFMIHTSRIMKMGLLRFLLFIASVIPWLIMVIMICAFSDWRRQSRSE